MATFEPDIKQILEILIQINNPILISLLVTLLLFSFIYLLFYKIDLPAYSSLLNDIREKENKIMELNDKISQSVENERKIIAAELHDFLGHDLAVLQKILKQNSHLRNRQFEAISELINNTIIDLQNIYRFYQPEIIDTQDLFVNIKSICSRVEKFVGLKYNLDFQLNVKTPLNGIGIVLFRITQECINNIVKHSQANEYVIKFMNYSNDIRLIIIDNGIGFDTEKIPADRKTCGLKNMEERIKSIGGKMLIESGHKQGTILYFQINNNEKKY